MLWNCSSPSPGRGHWRVWGGFTYPRMHDCTLCAEGSQDLSGSRLRSALCSNRWGSVWLAIGLYAVIQCFVSTPEIRPERENDRSPWCPRNENFDDAIAAAGKNALVLFCSDFCPWCKNKLNVTLLHVAGRAHSAKEGQQATGVGVERRTWIRCNLEIRCSCQTSSVLLWQVDVVPAECSVRSHLELRTRGPQMKLISYKQPP